jgi:hypothetical protein
LAPGGRIIIWSVTDTRRSRPDFFARTGVILAIRRPAAPKTLGFDISLVSDDAAGRSAGQVAGFEMNASVAPRNARLVCRIAECPPEQCDRMTGINPGSIFEDPTENVTESPNSSLPV